MLPITYDYPGRPAAPLADPEPEDEPEVDPEDEDATPIEHEPDEEPEGDEPNEVRKPVFVLERDEPEPPRPAASAVLGVGRSRASASVAPRTHDAQGRFIVPTGGPSPSARAEMLKKFGQVFDDATGRWVKETKS